MDEHTKGPAPQQAVGVRITSLDRVYELAVDRKSIWFDGWNGPKPAAFVIGMKLVTVKNFIDRGIYEYTPAKKDKPEADRNQFGGY